MTRHVQALAAEVWKARDAGALTRSALLLSQKLAVAAAGDVAECETYDPEIDDRVIWLREITAQIRRRPARAPRASADLEFRIQMLLGQWSLVPCGKDLAARN